MGAVDLKKKLKLKRLKFKYLMSSKLISGSFKIPSYGRSVIKHRIRCERVTWVCHAFSLLLAPARML